MHELSIARALVDLVEKRSRGARAEEVEVAVGALTGVVPECLAFSWEGLVAGTPLESARLEVRLVAARALCPSGCGAYEPEGFARVCPLCGALGGEVLSGDELDLVRLLLRETEGSALQV